MSGLAQNFFDLLEMAEGRMSYPVGPALVVLAEQKSRRIAAQLIAGDYTPNSVCYPAP